MLYNKLETKINYLHMLREESETHFKIFGVGIF